MGKTILGGVLVALAACYLALCVLVLHRLTTTDAIVFGAGCVLGAGIVDPADVRGLLASVKDVVAARFGHG